MRSGPVHGGVGTTVDVDIDRLMKSLSSAASAAGMKSDQALRSVKKKSGVASHGFTKKLPDDKSPAVRAAHEARASVAAVERWLVGVGALAVFAGLLWWGLVAYTQSDYVLGRLAEIDVPHSMRLLSAASEQGTAAASEMVALTNVVQGWTDGYLGKSLALMMFLTGMAAGLAKQSVGPPVIGVAMALILAYGPGVVGELSKQGVSGNETAVMAFERTRDVEALRKGLAKQAFQKHQVSYVVGQAIVMEAAGKEPGQTRKAELQGHLQVVRQALASGQFIDGKAHAVYAMEVAAYGKGTTGEAASIERNASMARQLSGASNYLAWVVCGLLSIGLVLATALVARVMRARELEDAADPVAQQHAAERLRQKVVGQANQVPYVNTSDSRDIEKLIRGIELAGVMAANKAAGR